MNFHCSGCSGQHKRPVGVKCQFKDNVDSDLEASGVNIDTNTDTVNHDILHALNSVSSRLTAIEQRIQNTEDQLQKGATSPSLHHPPLGGHVDPGKLTVRRKMTSSPQPLPS